MTVGDRVITGSGVEYVADIYGCDPDLLRSRERLDSIMARFISEVGVRPIREPLWQMFPAPGGITALWLLAESHLAVHTYPETGFAAVSLYCCGSPRDWPGEARLRAWFEADHVEVQTLERGRRIPSARAAYSSDTD